MDRASTHLTRVLAISCNVTVVHRLQDLDCPTVYDIMDENIHDIEKVKKYSVFTEHWSERWVMMPTRITRFPCPAPDYCVGFSPDKAFSGSSPADEIDQRYGSATPTASQSANSGLQSLSLQSPARNSASQESDDGSVRSSSKRAQEEYNATLPPSEDDSSSKKRRTK